MNVLVVGFGSIGERHARLLRDLECDVAVVSRRTIDEYPCYANITDGVKKTSPQYIVVSNSTQDHFAALTTLSKLDFDGKILVEKPLFRGIENSDEISKQQIYVAYNLRFHPLIQRIRKLTKNEKILSVQAYVGQYLPNWRSERDYRESYSAKQREGGGALRDLSHEFDYVQWLFGTWQCLTAKGGQYSTLEIDSDDVYVVMLQTVHCPLVTVQLNYLDRIGQREITINTDTLTIKADMVHGSLKVNNLIEEYTVDRDDTYRLQHQAILTEEGKDVCSFDEGMEVMKIVSAAEHTALSPNGAWVMR